MVLTVFCLNLGLNFNLVLLAVTARALIAAHIKREQRMYWDVVEAIRRRFPPPCYPR